jgi:putative hydrolase of the HAD superfamily
MSERNTLGLIFDYGNVLDYVDDGSPWLARRNEVAAEFNMTGDALWKLLYETQPWQDCKRGRITYDEFWNRILSPLGITDPVEQAKFDVRLFEGRDWINPDMALLMRELKPHYLLAVLSNTFDPNMESRIAEQHGLKEIFDAVVSSAAVGLAKPEPEIYTMTLHQLGIAPAQALFVDDLPRNTRAAEALGIPSIVFTSPLALRQELKTRAILPARTQARAQGSR